MKRYTAQEMRETAKSIEADLVMSPLSEKDDVMYRSIVMLRQAADELERERKYEYACFNRVFQTLNGARIYAIANEFQGRRPTIVRREVGEWEEVNE